MGLALIAHATQQEGGTALISAAWKVCNLQTRFFCALNCALFDTFVKGHLNIVKALVRGGANVHAQQYGLFPINFAGEERHWDVVKYLGNAPLRFPRDEL